jgi:hypothetical protein
MSFLKTSILALDAIIVVQAVEQFLPSGVGKSWDAPYWTTYDQSSKTACC